MKKFRAWDGESYWYSDDQLSFINDYKLLEFRVLDLKLSAVDQFTGKIANQVMIYENDLIINPHNDATKVFQVVWSSDECGFRKVPHGMPYPETKIDEAFMEVIGTIHSYKEK